MVSGQRGANCFLCGSLMAHKIICMLSTILGVLYIGNTHLMCVLVFSVGAEGES